MSRLILATATLLWLAACDSSIVLKNPKTGEIAQCNGRWDSNRASICAQGYLSDGWVRLN